MATSSACGVAAVKIEEMGIDERRDMRDYLCVDLCNRCIATRTAVPWGRSFLGSPQFVALHGG